MDNLDPNVDNQDPVADTDTGSTEQAPTQTAAPSPFTWKDRVGNDFANSPTISKFEDTVEGLQKAMASHLNLEKLLGHEKVPLPKGPEDVEGRARFNKAIGVPEKSDGYELPDPSLPGEMSKLTFDKNAFAQIAHDHNLTPDQAKGLWAKYTELSGNIYQKHATEHQANLDKTMNALRNEWGDAYASKVELAEMVINKFASDKEAGDYITAVLSKDAKSLKFLASIGEQFAENKVGEFRHAKYALSPDEAEAEYSKILSNPDHPYLNEKATQKEHEAAIEYVNRLIGVINRPKGQA